MTAEPSELDDLRRRVVALEQRVADLHATLTPPPLPPVSAGPARPAVTLAPPLAQPRPASAAVPPAPARDPVASITWIGAAGALIFLVGASYGLAVSIEYGWLSAPVRVAAGLIIGLALGVLAGRLLIRGGAALGVGFLAAGAGTWMFALHYGAHDARLFAAAWGWLGAWLAVLAGGGLAARTRRDGALAVSLAVGWITPLLFHESVASLPVLLAHGLALSGGALAIHYLTGTGAHWRWTRLVIVLGAWGVMAWGTGRLLAYPQPAWGLVLLISALGAGLFLAWLPRHAEVPLAPGAMTVGTILGFALAWWNVSHALAWPREAFAGMLTVLAALSLGLIIAARRRTGGREHDLALGLLGVGLLLLAVPVAVEWRWVGLGWGLLAAGLSLGAWRAQPGPRPHLMLIAFIAATAASVVWLGEGLNLHREVRPVFNLTFLNGVLASTAWAGLALVPGPHRRLVLGILQVMGVHVVAWELARILPTVVVADIRLPLGTLAITLSYCLAGATQWVWSLTRGARSPWSRPIRALGYAWLVAAGVKLMAHDLAGAEPLLRAVAALGVGVLLLGAAWGANHLRRRAP